METTTRFALPSGVIPAPGQCSTCDTYYDRGPAISITEVALMLNHLDRAHDWRRSNDHA